MKTCTKCKETKELNCFAKDYRDPNRVRSICKLCRNQQRKERYAKNEVLREKSSQRRLKYYIKHREELILKEREYRRQNKEKIRIRDNEKRRTNIQHRLRSNLRSGLTTRMRRIFKGKNKGGSSVGDLGCTMKDFMLHIESLFLPGMTWKNYGSAKYPGTWNIDHIIPLSSFDLTDREQFLKASHYTNLQPLWTIDNLRKKDRLPEELEKSNGQDVSETSRRLESRSSSNSSSETPGPEGAGIAPEKNDSGIRETTRKSWEGPKIG
jgi:hypothetical protein